jgi:enterochelin esterase family protein
VFIPGVSAVPAGFEIQIDSTGAPDGAAKHRTGAVYAVNYPGDPNPDPAIPPATPGDLAQILDNLLAQGKAVPMIVVVPEAHALPPEATPVISPNFITTVTPYLPGNQRAVDAELFHDIIPFIEAHYNISDEPRKRAIAGLSLGGLQAIETGIVHLGYFRWIGTFSAGVGVTSPALSEEFKNALKDPNKINENLYLFEIFTGDNDRLIGKDIAEFEAQLKQANIQHLYTVLPGTHSMFVGRPALANFLQEIFKP